MKYRVQKMTPEFYATSLVLSVLSVGLLLALYLSYVNVEEFFFGYIVLFVASMVKNHYLTEIVEEDKYKFPL